MRIEAIEVRQLSLPMVESLAAAHATTSHRQTVLVHAITDAGEGWGECVALNEPTYSGEWSNGEYQILVELFAPHLVATKEIAAGDVSGLLEQYAQHHPAKCALETALLDAQLRAENRSFAEYLEGAPIGARPEKLGSRRTRVECCAVASLIDGAELLQSVHRLLELGYRHLKLKIAPGHDLKRVDAVLSEFPGLPLQVDANGSYRWDEPSHRKLLLELDQREIVLIEQPLPTDRAYWYQELRETLRTPIALDESVSSIARAIEDTELKCCDVVKVKPGMIGGYIAAARLRDECTSRGAQVALGGMIETGVARAANLALAATSGFERYPAEIAPDGRWFENHINYEPVVLDDGFIQVPTGPGIGVDLDMDLIERQTVRQCTV